MIRNKRKLNRFYRKLMEGEDISHKEALRIYEALHKEAVSLGAINSENILEGIEVDLRITKAMGRLKRGRKANNKDSSKVRRR